MARTLSKSNVAVGLTLFSLAIAGLLLWYSSELPQSSFPAVNLTPEQSNFLATMSYLNARGERWSVPAGTYSFDVSSNPKLYPRFLSGNIDPLDVKVGDTQTMRITVVDVAQPAAVRAEIEHDAGKDTVQLSLVSTKALAREELERRPYLVDESGGLILNDASGRFSVKSVVERLVNRAEAEGEAEYVYEGKWVVHDTHTKTYRTTFVAESAAGRRDDFTMAWSDPICTFDDSGNMTNVGGCAFSAGTEGFDGSLVNLNGKTVTLSGSATFAYSPGSTVNLAVAGSGFVIGNGTSIQNVQLCIADADGDGYTSDAALVLGGATPGSCPGGSRTLASVGGGQNNIAANVDCLDSGTNAANVYRNVAVGISGGVDGDQDTYTAGVRGGTYCVGASATINSRTYYLDVQGTPGVQSTYRIASAVTTGDCNDADAAVQPDSYQTGQGWYNNRSGNFWARTGMGGSLANDFNCDGTAEQAFVPYNVTYQGSGYSATLPKPQYTSICPDTSAMGQFGTFITISSGLTCGVGNTSGPAGGYVGSWFSYDPNAGCLKTAGSFVLFGSAMRACR